MGLGGSRRAGVTVSAAVPMVVVLAIATVAIASGCDLSNPGKPVAPRQLNFPIAIALGGEHTPGQSAPFLLVANSNFDLHFGSGTLQSYSIAAITAYVQSLIDAGACDPASAQFCRVDNAAVADNGLFVDEVLVASHMDGIALSSSGDRVYLASRSGRGGLTWVQLDEATGTLECGGALDPYHSSIERCDARHRSSDETRARMEGLTLPADPVAVVASALRDPDAPGEPIGDYVVLAHRNGTASLFLDTHGADPNAQPQLVDVISGLPFDIVNIEIDREADLVWLTSGAFAPGSGNPTERQTRDLAALHVDVRVGGASPEIGLQVERRYVLRGLDDGFDTRDVALDPTRTDRMWVLSRRPESVITIDHSIEPFAVGEAPIGPIFPVGFGPARLMSFQLIDDLGMAADPLLLASCFDARSVFVIDPEIGAIATVAGFDGPFEMTIDPVGRRAYVVDFRVSYVWVVDLEPLLEGGSPVILARIGTGRAPTVFM
jgi:hypothetical protein